jgi:hypothetical protein
MHDQRILTPAEEDGQIDSAILGLLIDPDVQRPWSREEIDREIGSDTTDSLNRLFGAGLIHRLDGFVWVTRAAIAAEEIAN